MPAYVIAHLQDAAPHPDIAEYVERISGTFEPYGGRFLVHATRHEVKEGNWPGDIIMIDGVPEGYDPTTTAASIRAAALAAE